MHYSMDTPCGDFKSLNKMIKNGFVMKKFFFFNQYDCKYCISKNL